MVKREWTREWPTKMGWYWFYGWKFGKKVYDLKPSYHIIRVRKVSNGIMIVGDGHFWDKKEGADGWFIPAEMPMPPQE